MKISFFEVENWEEEYLKKSFRNAKFFSSPLTNKKLKKVKDTEIISVFIYSKLDEAKLRQLPNLKLITTRSTGYDHIDIDYCQKNNIIVTNVPAYGENTVAEHAFALILAISRKIIPSVERAKCGNWSLAGLRGFDLANKTIGIVGTGNIGEQMVRIAYGFEMKILGFDLKHNSALSKKYDLRYVKDLSELFARSDIISLHLPLNEHTEHIVNRELLEKTKHGAILINTARGSLVESEDLMWALDNNILAFAGLDVLEEEPFILEERELLNCTFKAEELRDLICERVLLRHPKVVITPHNAFNSQESIERILDITISNIKKFSQNNISNEIK